jgi:site-specific DNA-methyltransferase (adenine-specific)
MKKKPLEITYLAPSKLVPFVGNPRNNEHAIEPVKKSIEHFGFINPIIARKSDSMIIAGHTRWKAALKDDLKEVPVIFVDLSENDSKLYNLADNKLGELAEWDIPGLDSVLDELREFDVDVSIAGFGDEYTAIELETNNEDKMIKSETITKCPKCGFEF